MLRSLSFALVAIITLSTCSAQQSLFDSNGRVDVEAIRRQAMAGMPLPNDLAFPGTFDSPVADSSVKWGLRLMPVPALFTNCHKLLVDGNGLLVVEVADRSAAYQAGIRSGMVLLSIDNKELRRLEDVPQLADGCQIRLLTEKGLQTTRVNLSGPTASTGPAGVTNFDSVSVSNNNGQIRIRATLKTQSGPQQIDLQGNRDEIDRQIDELPAELGNQLRRQVSY